MARTEEIAIDLDSLTPGDWADVRAVALAGGVADLDAVDMAAPSWPVLAGLIFVTLRRRAPRITPKRCVRLALAHLSGEGVAGG